MDTLIISCETIKDELNHAIAETNCGYPVVWLESGLHNYPEKLRARLQETLNGVAGYARVLMGFGYCGNSIAGIKTGGYETIFPRADDCITILLGSYATRKQHERTYFMTKGWLAGEKNIWWEYQYTIKKYGKKRGKEIYAMVLENYRNLGLLDTGAYDINELNTQTMEIAKELGLEHKILPATTGYIKKLLTGPWPEKEFLTIPPNHEITTSQLMLS